MSDPKAPDGRPRQQTVPVSERGFQSSLRSALALLSSGANGLSKGDEGTVLGLQIESPEPRVLRMAFALNATERAFGEGNPTLVEIAEGMDGAAIVRTYVVPLQGLALAVSAGVTRVTVTSPAVFAITGETRFHAALSCGVLARRWYRDHLSDVTAIALYPLVTSVAAPVYAVRALVTVLTGSLAEPVSGVPTWLAGQQVTLSPDEYGLLGLSAGSPNTVVTITWEIVE